jgi:penicillin G amidase
VRLLGRLLTIALAMVAVLALIFAANVAVGMRVHSRDTGTISGLAVREPVSILRDDRGVPHVIARNEHDLFFAQGYAQGSDRLFQMDLLRRFILGELAEVYGARALATDEKERAVPVRAMVQTQWQRLDTRSRELLGAFSDGVNAAIDREPLPVEFRILAYRPRPWTPQDSLSVAMVTVLDLIDDWDSIASRDAAFHSGGLALLNARFPFTDACYDAPVLAGLSGMSPGPGCRRHTAALLRELGDARPPVGSNEWAVGSNKTVDRRALLANDPHLALQMPGVWYLMDLRAPGYHVAGAALPGCPTIVLGHNESIAWGATDGTVTSLSVFDPPARLDNAAWQTETFRARFRSSATKRYYRTPREFGLTTTHGKFVLVRWSAYDHPVSPLQTFVELDRASSASAAIATLSKFPGPTQNFVVTDTAGHAAYALAGEIPNDPVRGRWIHPSTDLPARYPPIPFSRLPKVAPSRDAILWTANNKMYPGAYPLPLSPQFAPPYRAYRIAQLLRARRTYNVEYFTQMQMDALSLSEHELARDIARPIGRRDAALGAALAAWDGEMNGESTTATVVENLRLHLTDRHAGRMPAVLATDAGTSAALRSVTLPSPAQWRIAGSVPVLHPLSSLGIGFLNGTTLPGYGDALALHVQYPGYSQSFRAVWDAGNWDAGGITLPQGESGEPGSGHYTDQVSAWIAGRLWPLPFSAAAVQRTAVDRETLSP